VFYRQCSCQVVGSKNRASFLARVPCRICARPTGRMIEGGTNALGFLSLALSGSHANIFFEKTYPQGVFTKHPLQCEL
jgi:hypothetical protein